MLLGQRHQCLCSFVRCGFVVDHTASGCSSAGGNYNNYIDATFMVAPPAGLVMLSFLPKIEASYGRAKYVLVQEGIDGALVPGLRNSQCLGAVRQPAIAHGENDIRICVFICPSFRNDYALIEVFGLFSHHMLYVLRLVSSVPAS